jgi:hypothetical protein
MILRIEIISLNGTDQLISVMGKCYVFFGEGTEFLNIGFGFKQC